VSTLDEEKHRHVTSTVSLEPATWCCGPGARSLRFSERPLRSTNPAAASTAAPATSTSSAPYGELALKTVRAPSWLPGNNNQDRDDSLITMTGDDLSVVACSHSGPAGDLVNLAGHRRG